jgi:hypothetical protein
MRGAAHRAGCTRVSTGSWALWTVPTSVEETLLITGSIDRLLALDRPLLPTGAEEANRVIGLGLAGRRDEARQALANVSRERAWSRPGQATCWRGSIDDRLIWSSSPRDRRSLRPVRQPFDGGCRHVRFWRCVEAGGCHPPGGDPFTMDRLQAAVTEPRDPEKRH